ncbi:MAG TPA: hypothetical protein VFQ68_32190 [Streptosporangiaceae bacterium]|nr:hypothetical protein [Streptosporangiaceae bacterium]
MASVISASSAWVSQTVDSPRPAWSCHPAGHPARRCCQSSSASTARSAVSCSSTSTAAEPSAVSRARPQVYEVATSRQGRSR